MTIRPQVIRRRRRTPYGFTLIELMIAIVVSSIVVLGVFAFSQIQQSTAGLHERDVRVQQSLEGAMWTMGRDIRGAGYGIARHCTEIRIRDALAGLINPGGTSDPGTAFRGNVTGEALWVLRDGLQAHWNSEGASSWDGGGADSSAAAGSHADSFDLLLGEPGYVHGPGVFTLGTAVVDGDTVLDVRTHTVLDGVAQPEDLSAVQQIFPPGTFFLLAGPPAGLPFDVTQHGQCALLQVTGDVTAGGPGTWQIPIGTTSAFNADLDTLLLQDPAGDQGAQDDWSAGRVSGVGASVLPLGRLRWSRYEIDYGVADLPYLVRKDIIGFQAGDPDDWGAAVDYPWCEGGNCPGPRLHLPGGNDPPAAVAVGPLVEDLQVAVGCDGYTTQAVTDCGNCVPVPDATFEEDSAGAVGTNNDGPNVMVDEYGAGSGGPSPDGDEWLGNAPSESWAPDCVFYGTGQYQAGAWAAADAPAFRMSPQLIRVSLVGAAEFESPAGGVSTNVLPALEDRAYKTSFISGYRERFTLTERFAPANLRWRDPYLE